jgi:hypothetical protein
MIWHVHGVNLDLLQLLLLLLYAETTANINGDPAQVLEPTRHSLQENFF